MLLLILVALLGIAVQLRELIRLAKKQDFTVEDAEVKAMTAAVASATSELPPTPKQGE